MIQDEAIRQFAETYGPSIKIRAEKKLNYFQAALNGLLAWPFGPVLGKLTIYLFPITATGNIWIWVGCSTVWYCVIFEMIRRLARRRALRWFVTYETEVVIGTRKPFSQMIPSYPRFLELMGWILPERIHTRVYEPAQQELIERFLLARRKYRTKWARRWIAFCFFAKTLYLVADCMRAAVADSTISWLIQILKKG